MSYYMKYRVLKQRILAIVVVLVAVAAALLLLAKAPFTNNSLINKHPFRLGLDLSGGTHLLYKADTAALGDSDPTEAMDVLRSVIERRVNLFGVSEPTVQTQTSTITGTTEHRLSVELPGVTDVSQAIALIGQTPFLEFKVQSDGPQKVTVGKDGVVNLNQNDRKISRKSYFGI